MAMLLENNYYPHDPRVRREAESLVLAGFDITVICPGMKGQPSREVRNGVRIWRYPGPADARDMIGYVREYGYSLVAALFLVSELGIRYGVDVIHAANPPDLFVLIAMLCRPFGVRFIYDQHDLAPEMYRARYWSRCKPSIAALLQILERISYRFADHVLVTNYSYMDCALKRGNVSPDRVSIVRNGPDDAQLGYLASHAVGLKTANQATIVYLGLMGALDGVDHLIQALHHLRYELGRIEFRCILVGSGEELPNLRQLACALGLEEYVHFTGFLPDPEFIAYLQAADICVDPDPSSEYNDRSTMLKIMDYMAAAKPIVAFDLPETRCSAAAAALYVKPNDELEFAKALAHLIDNPDQRREMGRIGRRRVEGDLSWSSSAKSLLRAYETVLNRGHGEAAYRAQPSTKQGNG
ncbi:MAG: glycosyltransferase family 4 protein [Acidobacteria bacterium]|nr:glycosyltransferase family 4 protein [Acidobacteriota bacterium]